MANLTTQAITLTGTALAESPASAGGDTVQCDSDVVLLVRNGGSSSVTVTLDVTKTEAGTLAVPDVTLPVAAGATATFGPIRGDLFANAVDNRLHVSYSGVSGVVVAALAL